MTLLSSERKKINQIQEDLLNFTKNIHKKKYTIKKYREYFEALRKAVHAFEDIVQRVNTSGKDLDGEEKELLFELVGDAILKLGGVSEPSSISLKKYDHFLYGPFLGISDEGSAVHDIRRAALSSPKMSVLRHASPIQVGVAHDAERLAAVGEVAVGPDEYKDIILGSQGSLLISTNVGTRLNLRYYKMRPIVGIKRGPFEDVIKNATLKIKKILRPFIHTLDNNPKPLTILLYFNRRTPFQRRLEVIKSLKTIMSKENFCNPECHGLGILADVVWGQTGLRFAKKNIELAKEAGIAEVAIQGTIRWEAENKISMPGLLNYFNPEHLSELILYAHDRNIILSTKNLVDPDTVARNVWSSLQAARNMGLQLGKYGLFPLTFEESDEVMELIQSWFYDWTAAPVFYIDFPHLSKDNVYTETSIVNGAKRWLDIVATHRISVVLIDTADKDKERRLLKSDPTDHKGILSLDQITEINQYAHKKEIRCLWAGGLTLPQVFELGELNVFGVYVTTSAAELRPLTENYNKDPMLTAERKPTFEGVYRANLILECGFLTSSLQKMKATQLAEDLKKKTLEFLLQSNKGSENKDLEIYEKKLANLAEEAWRLHFNHQSKKIRNEPIIEH
jgi:hypothetical protein